jgi:hypothetical protein
MAVALTIAAVAKKYRKGTLSLSETANGRATLSFDVRSNDGAYIPALDAIVELTDGATTLFSGPVDKPSVRGILGDASGAYEAIATRVNAVDGNAFIDRRIVITTIPAGNTEAALTQLISEYWADSGITLHAGQVAGPDLPYMEFGGWKGSDVLNHLAVLTAGDGEPFVWRVNADNELRMFQPSTENAPFNIVEGDGSTVGDVTVESARDSSYANKITCRIPATATTADIWVYAEDGAESAAHGTWDKFFVLHDQPTEADAQIFAVAELARSIKVKQIVKYHTFATGLFPGQTQDIEYPSRGIDATGVITEIVTRDYGTNRLIRQVTLTIDESQTNLDRNWRDTYKLWAKDTGGSGQTPIPGEAESGVFGAAPPDTSVQYNNGGVFAGKSTFHFRAAGNSVVIGTGSSIDAVAFDSCLVVGINCRITDP